MKEITVVSGKGGTGKTSVIGAFASFAASCVIADCDVDAYNLHLTLKLESEIASEPFFSGFTAQFDNNLCDKCGLCVSHCRFGALEAKKALRFNPLYCEGCGVCVDVCPRQAVSLVDKKVGTIIWGKTKYGILVQGRLAIASSTSGKLVTSVRKKARAIADKTQVEYLLVDGSPGIGCPVIASLTGVDAAVIVTEPTVSGKHDLERILELCRHFNLQTFVIINKCNLNLDKSQELIKLIKKFRAIFAGQIPFDKTFYQALSERKCISEYQSAPGAIELKKIWQRVHEGLISRNT